MKNENILLKLPLLGALLMIFLVTHTTSNQEAGKKWQPIQGKLMTRWSKQVAPGNVHSEYPRPQMVRKEWLNLNGLWEYAIKSRDQLQPEVFDGEILVPFAVESALSGAGKTVGADKILWYRRSFEVSKNWSQKRILLNFGAVDWQTMVWINGKQIGEHRGGYDAFTFDITDALVESSSQEIVLAVWDPIDEGTQPRGKQVSNPRGIWYTSVTGIWQTVWIEPVSEAYIKQVDIIPDIDAETVTIHIPTSDAGKDFEAVIEVLADGQSCARVTSPAGVAAVIPLKNPQPWSPDSPFLYDLKVTLQDINEKSYDEISSYFGMRKISLGNDDSGVMRLCLNNEPLFQLGPLDQGWWPDGLYTAPTDEALRYDIEVMKKLGFNMARKHVKIEPDRWYYWCDKLGLMVWQDMPSGDEYIDPNEPDFQRSDESAAQFEYELKRMIDYFGNHPCIVMWVPFNEGWGQYDTPRIVNLIKNQDPFRLVDCASGWADRVVGDVHDVHAYPGPAMPDLEEHRAAVLGEFGGLGLPLKGHTWQDEKNWGYRNFTDTQQLTSAYIDLFKKLEPLKAKGLSAAIYTQITDVEIEVNGLMTYDRAVIKMNPKQVARVNNGFLPPVIDSENEIFLDSASVRLYNISQQGEIRYTLDGSEPAKSSVLYREPIQITETTTIKAKTIWSDDSESDVNEHTYRKVMLRQPEPLTNLKPGIKYSYYENDEEQYNRLPDFNSLSPKTTGIAPQCDLRMRQREDNFAIKFEGYIRVDADGIYTFYSESDDGSQLFIGATLVVDNDFTHGMTEESGQIALAAGFHPFKLTFFQGVGGKGLVVSYRGPDGKKMQIIQKILFSRNE